MDTTRRNLTTRPPSARPDRQLERSGRSITARRRLELVRQGLGHLWASRNPLARLELEDARVREATGRHQVLQGLLGQVDVPRPRSTLRGGEFPAELEGGRLRPGAGLAPVVWLQGALALEVGLALAAWAWWG